MVGKFKFISKKKKEKLKIFKYGENFLGGTITEINDNKSATVDGCMGVTEYRDDYIKLKLKKGSMIFCGAMLNITFFENETITISGNINNIEFCV